MIVLHSHWSPEECRERLKIALDAEKRSSIARAIVGKSCGDCLRLARTIHYRNTFRRYLYIQFLAAERGTRIEAHFRNAGFLFLLRHCRLHVHSDLSRGCDPKCKFPGELWGILLGSFCMLLFQILLLLFSWYLGRTDEMSITSFLCRVLENEPTYRVGERTVVRKS